MNFFEEQLREMFDEREEFCNVKYIGRAAYIPLENGVNIKVEFANLVTSERWDAIRLTAIGNGGQTGDIVLLRFSDYCHLNGRSRYPYAWVNSGETEWYTAPTYSEMQHITNQISDYISIFDTVQSQNSGMGMQL